MRFPIGNIIGESMNAKRSSFGVNSLIGLVIAGIMFVGGGLYFYKSAQINESWIKIDGTIVDVDKTGGSATDNDTTYSPIVSYKVGNNTYRIRSNISDSSYPKVGEKKQVAYNPNNPSDSKIVSSKSTQMLILLFPVLGVFLIILGPFLYFRSQKRTQSINSLLQTGQKVTGVVQDIINTGSTNGYSTYKIVVAATDLQGQVTNFKSDELTGIMGLAMNSFQGKTVPIDVYIDQSNPANYYVDISDIPSLTSETITQMVTSIRGTGISQNVGVQSADPNQINQSGNNPG